jgi:hypothetical protein
MDLNPIDETKQTVIETCSIDEISDVALDRGPRMMEFTQYSSWAGLPTK